MQFEAKITFECNERQDAEMLFTLMRESFCNWELDRGVKERHAVLLERHPELQDMFRRIASSSTV